jgi:hypothetical protein
MPPQNPMRGILARMPVIANHMFFNDQRPDRRHPPPTGIAPFMRMGDLADAAYDAKEIREMSAHSGHSALDNDCRL